MGLVFVENCRKAGALANWHAEPSVVGSWGGPRPGDEVQ